MNRAFVLAALGAGGYLAYRAMMPRYDYRGKHAVVTGGSRGLGLVLARQLGAAGARVSICSRDPKELERALDDLTGRGVQATAVECDVTDRGRVREFLAHARRQNGPIDVLINNAGVIRVGPAELMGEEDFEQSLKTHFWAALYTCLEVLPEMKARRAGRIVNVASVGGKIAVPHLLPYSTGKFALVGFSNGLRGEVAADGVVVTTVSPGLMRTGSHLNAEFKGRNEDEYAWFALGNGLPGLSVGVESAAEMILAACARGDGELVLGLPAKLAVAAQALAPNLAADALKLVDRLLLPATGGDPAAVTRGRDSRGKLNPAFTRLTDRAAARTNELHAAAVPPPLPTHS